MMNNTDGMFELEDIHEWIVVGRDDDHRGYPAKRPISIDGMKKRTIRHDPTEKKNCEEDRKSTRNAPKRINRNFIPAWAFYVWAALATPVYVLVALLSFFWGTVDQEPNRDFGLVAVLGLLLMWLWRAAVMRSLASILIPSIIPGFYILAIACAAWSFVGRKP